MGQFTKIEVIDKIEILEDNQIQIRKATRVFEDGVFLSQTYHRHVVAPDSDIKDEDDRVKKVHKALCTQEVIDKYKSDKAAMVE